jgi:phenylacetate-CoA ligase
MAVSTGGSLVDPVTYQASFDGRISELVDGAARRSEGFRDRLAAASLDADGLNDAAALDRLPVLTKDELLELQHTRPPFGGMLADDAEVRRTFQSPGPLYEPEVESGDAWRWGPALTAAGFSTADRVLVAFGFHLSPAGAMFEAACLELGATVLPAGVGNKEAQVRACRDLAITAYIGPPSYLKALLDAAEQEDVTLSIERAFVTAEPLPPSLRELLETQVTTVRQGYGTAETGNLGYECEAREGLHVPTDALVQICDLTTGEALHDDREGQLVVTLLSTAYPVVRFGTGDLSRWMLHPCSCGADTPRTQGWLGRAGDAVKVKGMFLHPRQVAEVVGGASGVERYRMVVDRVDHVDALRCELVVDGDPDEVAERVATGVREALRFNVAVEVVDDLDVDAPSFEDVRTWT